LIGWTELTRGVLPIRPDVSHGRSVVSIRTVHVVWFADIRFWIFPGCLADGPREIHRRYVVLADGVCGHRRQFV
jgi:hypothetical protein